MIMLYDFSQFNDDLDANNIILGTLEGLILIIERRMHYNGLPLIQG